MPGDAEKAVFSSTRLTHPAVRRASSEILVPGGANRPIGLARMVTRKNFAVAGANEIVHAPIEYSRTGLAKRHPGSSATERNCLPSSLASRFWPELSPLLIIIPRLRSPRYIDMP